MIPKEHGAWGMLAIPFCIGFLSAGKFHGAVMLLGISLLSYFLLRAPLLALKNPKLRASYRTDLVTARKWFAGYAFLLLSFSSPLLFFYHKWALLLFFAVSLPLMFLHSEYSAQDVRSLKNEFLSIAGLCLSAPAAYYVSSGELSWTAFSLWVLCFFYYGGAVFYVKMNAHAIARKNDFKTWKEKITFGKSTFLYYILLFIITFISARFALTPSLSWLAFLPSLAKAAVRIFTLQKHVSFKKLGWMEVTHSLVFASLLIASFRAE